MTPETIGADCGRTLEELSDYLHTGSSPDAEHLRNCPQCQAVLAALRRLDDLTAELIALDIRQAGSGDEPWLQNILDHLRLETRAGRAIPLAGAHPDDDLSETEGAVIALIRTVGDTLPGATIGKCRLHGDLTTAGAPVTVHVNVTAFWGHPVPALANTLRSTLSGALALHTELNITAVDITVTDLVEDADGATRERIRK
ncbi:Asp23/Gls24 family envelope stress response protein [Pseudarthrobacter sp. S9]|uniref:Asp23/Gls24 family envelope stress response protein n=1 Tax=Pseudarthrobacter sp. S9 TaxID=3418421 RepID=UPI003CFE4BC1